MLYSFPAKRMLLAEREKGPKADAWWQKVVEVQLVGRGLRRMQGLERLTSLIKASFARNEISHIQGLDACTALQELSFEVRVCQRTRQLALFVCMHAYCRVSQVLPAHLMGLGCSLSLHLLSLLLAWAIWHCSQVVSNCVSNFVRCLQCNSVVRL